jgi:hypothetical protein
MKAFRLHKLCNNNHTWTIGNALRHIKSWNYSKLSSMATGLPKIRFHSLMSWRLPWNLCRTRLPLCRPYPVRLQNQDVLKPEPDRLVEHGVLSRIGYQGWMAPTFTVPWITARLSCSKCMNLPRILAILRTRNRDPRAFNKCMKLKVINTRIRYS